MKHKSETTLKVIRGLVLDFVLFFCYYMTKYPLYVTSAQSAT